MSETIVVSPCSQIYKCACKGYKERLLDDVKKLVKEHCVGLKAQLDLSVRNSDSFHIQVK